MGQLAGHWSSLGWVALKALLMFAVAVAGFRIGERRTLAQLGPYDFAVAVSAGALIARTATASTTSFAMGAVALATLLAAHRVVVQMRFSMSLTRLFDHGPRILVVDGHVRAEQLRPTGLTEADLMAILRQQGVTRLSDLRYVIFETKGDVSIVRRGQDPGDVVREVLQHAVDPPTAA